jgi:prepilin-type processing-associated H-X9-DG protein
MRRIVTIAVGGVVGLFLIGLFVPLLLRWRMSADRARCENNLRQLAALALLDYAQKHKEFPAGTIVVPNLPPEKRLSWLVPLLPRLGQPTLGSAIDRTAAWNTGANRDRADTLLPVLICPAIYADHPADNPAPLHYPGMAGVGPDGPTLSPDSPRAGAFRYDAPTPITAFRDGLSNCLLLLETGDKPGRWLAGGPACVRPLDPMSRPYVGPDRPFGGGHLGGANAAFADGSVRFLTDRISPDVLEMLAAIADGNPAENSQ